jgi:hypothetical protein
MSDEMETKLAAAAAADIAKESRPLPRLEGLKSERAPLSPVYPSGQSPRLDFKPATGKQTAVDHLRAALDALKAVESDVMALGAVLIGDAGQDKAKPSDASKGYQRPIVGHVHVIADEVERVTAAIKAEIARIMGGL